MLFSALASIGATFLGVVLFLTGSLTGCLDSIGFGQSKSVVTLLLPGFHGRQLEAGLIGSVGETATYMVTCPTSRSTPCGIPGKGLEVTAAPTAASIVNVDESGYTATVSCQVAGTTSASCRAAHGTVEVQGTLAPKDLNWMSVTITGSYTPTPTPSNKPPALHVQGV
ncbi:hypothetical protein N7468_004088 [Penicillium chermesinum]|uniref:Uncharacterized protein n=1 Tax=Penicillium chermesinum TaxID=63820 RepID=A0A9W9TU00_9EURO|nr:uncharacterized protein N7468_004088 [Penicillium chermesinum]KAJ5239469.1 hypothetical protein N7468_004088 [Penicillium chermesinum]